LESKSIAYIKASNAKNFSQLGYIVALSGDGNTMAVSFPQREDSNAKAINGNQTDHSAVNSGAVYVLLATAMAWAQQAYVISFEFEERKGYQFGSSVALSNDGTTHRRVGAVGEASSATGD